MVWLPYHHCSTPILISPFPLTFQPPQTSCCSSDIHDCFVSFAYSVPFVHIAFLLLLCWKNSCSSFKTLFFEAFIDVASPLVDVVNHLLLCMTSVLCNECSTCSCLHVYVSCDTEPLEVYMPPISVFPVLSTGPDTHEGSANINWTYTECRA